MPKYFIHTQGLATRLFFFNGVVHLFNDVYSEKVRHHDKA
jgi:hypothetical protein